MNMISRGKYRYLVCSTFICLLAIATVCGQAANNKYPGHERPSCLAQPALSDLLLSVIDGADKAKAALAEAYSSELGVWNQQTLLNSTSLTTALREYSQQKRGLSVRNLRLANKTPEQIHQILMAAGFKYRRIALPASFGRKLTFWMRDGTESPKATALNLVPQDIYVHADGGLVRVKPEGIPAGPRSRVRRRQPHVSKSVLLNLKPICPSQDEPCYMDTSFKNEGFKVTEAGVPVPKGPAYEFGFKPLHSAPTGMIEMAENNGWVDYIMSMAHSNVAFDFMHCLPKSPKQKRHR